MEQEIEASSTDSTGPESAHQTVNVVYINPSELEHWQRQGWHQIGMRRDRDNVTLLKLERPVRVN